MTLDVAIFGCGYAGSRWAEIVSKFEETGRIYCVDPDSSQIENLSSTSASFINFDVLTSQETFTQTEQTQFRTLSQCDIWIVAVKRGLHKQFIELADSCGVETIIVEKPVYQTLPQDVETYETNVCVNYVETVSPVFNSVIEAISKDNTQIDAAFHWRGKDARSSIGPNSRHQHDLPAVQEDLVHDFSELYIGFSMLNHPTNFNLDSIHACIPWKQVDYNNTRPFTYLQGDAWAKLTYTTDTGSYTVQGGFIDEKTRRFFLWADSDREVAYYGNTLLRDYTYPMSYRITGASDISTVATTLKSGTVITKEDEQALFNSVSAEPLIENSRKQHQANQRYMFRTLLDGDPVPTLQDAYHIEHMADQFYKTAPVKKYQLDG